MRTFQHFEAVFTRNSVLEDLGIETEPDYYFGPCVIDLERVESWWNCERQKDDENPTINVKMQSGDIFSLVISFDDFTKLMT